MSQGLETVRSHHLQGATDSLRNVSPDGRGDGTSLTTTVHVRTTGAPGPMPGRPAAVLLVQMPTATRPETAANWMSHEGQLAAEKGAPEALVVYANAAAADLAPGLALPVSTTTWSQVARLHGRDGRPLQDGDHPLTRVANGEPVEGVVVTAAHPTMRTEAREPLWAVAVPLSGAPGPLAQQVLVTFLRLSDTTSADAAGLLSTSQEAPGASDAPGAGGEEEGSSGDAPVQVPGSLGAEVQLLARAVDATDVSFTVSDPRLADNPLVWVNSAFTRTTGYTFEDAVGNNCRYLQGPETDRTVVGRLRRAIREEETVTEVLLNYRADGTTFWNEVSINPVFDGTGQVVHFVGVQADVTRRIQGEAERDASHAIAAEALRSEQAARAAAEQARSSAEHARREAVAANSRLALLAEATQHLTRSLDTATVATRLAELAVPALADWVVVTVAEATAGGDAHPTQVVVRHRDGHDELAGRYEAAQQSRLARDSGKASVIADGRVLHGRIDNSTEKLLALAGDPALAQIATQLGAGRHITVPLAGRRRVLGSLSLIWMPDTAGEITDQQLSTSRDLAARAGLALDNARLYSQEHNTAVLLQRSLLPELPPIPGLRVATAYLPSGTGNEVGGDWYDVLPLTDGDVGLIIGDVMGHDLAAAAAMGRLRAVLRAYAHDNESPAAILNRLDRLSARTADIALTTCIYACLHATSTDSTDSTRRAETSRSGHTSRSTGTGGTASAGDLGDVAGARLLTYSNAGHHPPLLRLPDGTVTSLDDPAAAGLLLGVDLDLACLTGPDGPGGRGEASAVLPAGSTLLLFTDGLIESRTRSLTDGLRGVSALLAEHKPAAGPQALMDALTALVADYGQEDDVCLLAITT